MEAMRPMTRQRVIVAGEEQRAGVMEAMRLMVKQSAYIVVAGEKQRAGVIELVAK